LPLVDRYTGRTDTPSEIHMTRNKPTLADLLAQCDPSAPYASEVWADAQPVGREFGVPVGDAETPLERLRGTLQRYDNPTDPVWLFDDET
jgi:hypothetical protein